MTSLEGMIARAVEEILTGMAQEKGKVAEELHCVRFLSRC